MNWISNKANSLGQSKASLRSLLPAGDLRRYIKNNRMKKIYCLICLICLFCIAYILLFNQFVKPMVFFVKDLLIQNGIGPNTVTPLLAFISICVTFFFAYHVYQLTRVQYASSIMLNFQNKWNDNKERVKRGLIKAGKCDEIFIKAINKVWNTHYAKVKDIEIEELIRKIISNYERTQLPDIKMVFNEIMYQKVNSTQYSVRDLLSDLLLSYDFLAVHISKRQPPIFNDFIKKYGQTLRQYSHILQVYLITDLFLEDEHQKNYKIDFMNLLTLCNMADYKLCEFCIIEIEKKQKANKYREIDLSILK